MLLVKTAIPGWIKVEGIAACCTALYCDKKS